MPFRVKLTILGFHLVGSLGFMFIGWQPSLVLITASAFAVFFCMPIINGSNRALMNAKVEIGMQGRVFAVSRMMTSLAQPLGYLSAGPLADKIFGPMLAPTGLLAGSVGRILGTGPGRGIGMVFVLVGVLGAAATIAAYLYRPIRLLEEELPDIADEKAIVEQEQPKKDRALSALVPNDDIGKY